MKEIVDEIQVDIAHRASVRPRSRTVAEFASQLLGGKILEQKVKSQLFKSSDSSTGLTVIEPPFDLEGLGQLMLKNTWHHACIKAKVSNLIGSGWRLNLSKEKVDELRALKERKRNLERIEKRTDSEEQELTDINSTIARYDETYNKIWSLFKRPNDQMTIIEIAENAFSDREGIGQGFWEITINAISAEPDHIFHIPAINMYKVKDRRGWLRNTSDGKRVFYKEWGDWNIYDKNTGELYGYFEVDEENIPIRENGVASIVWVREALPVEQWANAVITFYKYNPLDPYYGLPDSIPALPAMAGKEAADEFNYDEFDNYGIARWAVIVNGSQLSAEARKKIETFFEEDMNEHPHGVLLIHIPASPIPPLPGSPVPSQPAISFQRLDTEQHEAHFQEYRHDLRDEVLAAHNVPPHLVSIIESGNIGGGTGTTQMQNFVKNVIAPLKTKVEHQINRIIEDGFNINWLTFTFNTSDLTGELDQARVAQIYSNVYAMTINEMRDRAGLGPIDGGDRIFIVIPGIGLIFVDDLDEMDSILIPGGQIPIKPDLGEPGPEERPIKYDGNETNRE